MPNWPSIEAFVDGVISQTFGEPVVYQPGQAGAAQGSAFTVTAGRHPRVREAAAARARGVRRDGELRRDLGESFRLLESAGKGRLGDGVGCSVRGDDGAAAGCLRHAQPGTAAARQLTVP